MSIIFRFVQQSISKKTLKQSQQYYKKLLPVSIFLFATFINLGFDNDSAFFYDTDQLIVGSYDASDNTVYICNHSKESSCQLVETLAFDEIDIDELEKFVHFYDNLSMDHASEFENFFDETLSNDFNSISYSNNNMTSYIVVNTIGTSASLAVIYALWKHLPIFVHKHPLTATALGLIGKMFVNLAIFAAAGTTIYVIIKRFIQPEFWHHPYFDDDNYE